MQDKHQGRIFSELVAALSMVLDIEESRKLFHAWRVALLAWMMAERSSPAEEAQVFYAGLLHDIGAMGLDDHIVHQVMRSDGQLHPIVLSHAEKGAEIVAEIPGLGPAAAYIRQHHEHWDGGGFPARLAGDAISWPAQLLQTADLFDVMLRRPNSSVDDVLRSMQYRVGKDLSPAAYDALLDVMDDQEFRRGVAVDGTLAQLMQDALSRMPEIVFTEADPVQATIRVFARIIDAKHAYTAGHSQRVARYTVSLARKLGLAPEQVHKLETAALLHDFGKIAVPRAVLDKPAKLTEQELQVVRQHPGRTMELLKTISGLKDLALDAGCHHERFDGKGYPFGMRGAEIPLGARIIALADTFDAITSLRPYQVLRSPEDAAQVIARGQNSQFDPELASVAVRVLPEAFNSL